MKITQTLVAQVKRSNKKNWHDQAWHDFQSTPEVAAINMALADKNFGDTNKDIAKEAERNLEFATIKD